MEELLRQPLKLYRDSLRLANFLAKRNGTSHVALQASVRTAFRAGSRLTEPAAVLAAREACVVPRRCNERGFLTPFASHAAR